MWIHRVLGVQVLISPVILVFLCEWVRLDAPLWSEIFSFFFWTHVGLFHLTSTQICRSCMILVLIYISLYVFYVHFSFSVSFAFFSLSVPTFQVLTFQVLFSTSSLFSFPFFLFFHHTQAGRWAEGEGGARKALVTSAWIRWIDRVRRRQQQRQRR